MSLGGNRVAIVEYLRWHALELSDGAAIIDELVVRILDGDDRAADARHDLIAAGAAIERGLDANGTERILAIAAVSDDLARDGKRNGRQAVHQDDHLPGGARRQKNRIGARCTRDHQIQDSIMRKVIQRRTICESDGERLVDCQATFDSSLHLHRKAWNRRVNRSLDVAAGR